MALKATVEISGSVPDQLIQKFLQHIRTFDAENPGMELQLFMRADWLSTKEVEAMFKSLTPPFPFHVSETSMADRQT